MSNTFDDCASTQYIFTFDTTDDMPDILDDVHDCASTQYIFTFDTTDDMPDILDDVRDALARLTDLDGFGAVIVVRTDHPSPDLRDEQWHAFFDDLLEDVRRRIHDPAGEGRACALDS